MTDRICHLGKEALLKVQQDMVLRITYVNQMVMICQNVSTETLVIASLSPVDLLTVAQKKTYNEKMRTLEMHNEQAREVKTIYIQWQARKESILSGLWTHTN